MLTVQEDGTLEFNVRVRFYLEQGKSAEVKRLLAASAVDFDKVADSSGSTLLHYAAKYSNEKMIDFLIKSGCKVDVKDNEGYTPLMFAVQTKHRRTIKKLLLAGASITIKNNAGESSLSLMFRRLCLSQFLVDKVLLNMFLMKVKAECRDDNEIAERLLQAKCPLYYAVYLKNAFIIETMLRSLPRDAINACEPPTLAYSALSMAVLLEDSSIVKLLVDSGARVINEYMWICESGKSTPEKSKILEILLAHTDPRDAEKQLLDCDIMSKVDREIVNILARFIDFCAVKDGYTLMLGLVCNPHENVMGDLEHVVYDYNSKSVFGSTLLSCAAAWGNPSTVQFILNKNVDVNNTNKRGRSALFNAFYSEHTNIENSANFKHSIKIIYSFLEYGADIQIIDKNQLTLFDEAIFRQHFNLIRPVLAHLALEEAIGKEIKPLIRDQVASHPMLAHHYKVCRWHLKKMKRVIVHGTISLYKLLTDSDEKVIVYAENPEFYEKFNKVMRRRRSNGYYNFILRRRISKIIPAAELQIAAIEAFADIMKIHTAYRDEISIRKIISYLSGNDCKNLRDAV